MTNVQIERLLSLLENISIRLQRKDSTIIRLELELYLYNFEKRKAVERKHYIQTITLPYPLNLSVGSYTSIDINRMKFDGPNFLLEDLNTPVFDGNIHYSFETKDEYAQRSRFEKKHQELLRDGWQLVKEVIEDD